MGLPEHVEVSRARERYGASGKVLGYEVEIWHHGLNEHRAVRDRSISVLESKASSQIQKWVEKWDRIEAKRQEQDRRERGKESAEQATREAEAALAEAEALLQHTLSIDDAVDWGSLKNAQSFVFEPADPSQIKFAGEAREPVDYERPPVPQKPLATDDGIRVDKTLLQRLIPALRRKADARQEDNLRTATNKWQAAVTAAQRKDGLRRQRLADLRQEFTDAKADYERELAEQHALVDDLERRWRQKEANAVEEHAELVLNASRYPDWIKVDFDLVYSDTNGSLVVDYDLPDTSQIPLLKEVSYVASRDELKEKHISEAQRKALYDSVIYQIALRTLHELFEADEPSALQQITFNGWVETVDPATGQETRKCIASVQSTKAEFEALDLARVEPKACFRKLRGVAAASLAQLAPVTPILRIDRDDHRIVDSRDVADEMGADTNLAAMHWEDFEHLIRELFGKHFESDGGEVHVTQASRDGGVDAIAFDPDPIRGGKMVIQAKRYTNVVGVSAVRDLYGTVVNEGAVKGILITTSDYGADAYNFAKDKPLTLLNGGNLLHLLQEHGYKAKIDIEEARQLARQ